MKHKVKIDVPVTKRGLFGIKRTVMEKRTLMVDGKTYRKMEKAKGFKPFTIEEMMFYDDLFGD
jgi:hypothetical protein